METSARPIEPTCYSSMAIGRTPLVFRWIACVYAINDFSTDGLLFQWRIDRNQSRLANSEAVMMSVGGRTAEELPLSLLLALQTV